jgi:hypothetical protein
MRLSNNQLTHSLQDLLGVSRHVAGSLIQDPVHKHGYSLQNEFAISGGCDSGLGRGAKYFPADGQ